MPFLHMPHPPQFLCATAGDFSGSAPWEAPLYLLELLVELEPGVLPRLAAQGALMRTLCTAAAALADAARQASQVGCGLQGGRMPPS